MAGVRGAVAAARDHAAVMRSTLPDLDPGGLAADEAARPRDARGLAVGRDGRPVRVEVRYGYDGPITARRREAAAMARVLYNYLTNAVRFAADGRVVVWVFAVGAGLVRWVVENALADADRDWLDREAGGDPRVLFAGGRTRGGHGVGLAAAEVAAACFGVAADEAVRAGHLGAAAGGGCYRAWFHWPTADPANLDAPRPDSP